MPAEGGTGHTACLTAPVPVNRRVPSGHGVDGVDTGWTWGGTEWTWGGRSGHGVYRVDTGWTEWTWGGLDGVGSRTLSGHGVDNVLRISQQSENDVTSIFDLLNQRPGAVFPKIQNRCGKGHSRGIKVFTFPEIMGNA